MWLEILKNCARTYSSHSRVIASCSQDVKTKANYLPYSDIPAARRLPFIGTTLDLIAAGSAPKLHQFIDGRHQQLGPIFRETMGSTEIVFLSCPKMMRSVFLYEGTYPTHPLPEAWTIYNKKHGCQRGLFFMDGEEWSTNRRIMNRLLLNCNETHMRTLVSLATERLTKHWRNACKASEDHYEITNLENMLYRWSIDVILYVMLGEIYNNASDTLLEKIDEFAQNVYRIFEDSSKLMTFPPKFAEFFNLDIWKEFEKNVANVLQLGNEVMDQSITEFKFGNGVVSSMLEHGMSLDIVKRIFVDLIIAAGDTTSFASIWALYSLATNQTIQTKARSEIGNNIDNRYIRGIIRETLRLYPIAPFVGRFLAKDAIIGRYEIPKETLVILSLYTSGRDDSNFIGADKFDPSRWMRNSSGELCGVQQAHGTLPFSLGSRSCIGRKIAMIQMQSLLEATVCNFDIKCFNEKPVDVMLRLVAVPDQHVRLGVKLLE